MPDKVQNLLIVCQQGGRLDRLPYYGAMGATVSVAHALMRVGVNVRLVGQARSAGGKCGDVHFSGGPREDDVVAVLQKIGLVDTIIGISRADILRRVAARRYMIYHHNPGLPAGRCPELINATETPVVCVSECSRQEQIRLGVDPSLVHVVLNGLRSDIFHPCKTADREIHRLVFAGHLVHYKGLDIVLRAMQGVRQRIRDACLDVYGREVNWLGAPSHLLAPEWTRSDGSLDRARIEADIPGVVFRGDVSAETLAEALRNAGLLLMPSRIGETFGTVLVEAQACGCIPVVPRWGGFPETMQEGVTGYLYAENTPEALAAKVIDLWERGLPTEEQRRAAERWARENFSWDRTAAGLMRVIASIPPRGRLDRLWLRALVAQDRLVAPLRPLLHQARYYLRRLRETPIRRWPVLVGRWFRNRQGDAA